MKQTPRWKDPIFRIWAVALTLAVASACIAALAPRDVPWLYIHRAIVVAWTLGPPSWYLLDAQRRVGRNAPPSEAEAFFYDAASKFWGGVLAMLFGLYAGGNWIQ